MYTNSPISICQKTHSTAHYDKRMILIIITQSRYYVNLLDLVLTRRTDLNHPGIHVF